MRVEAVNYERVMSASKTSQEHEGVLTCTSCTTRQRNEPSCGELEDAPGA